MKRKSTSTRDSNGKLRSYSLFKMRRELEYNGFSKINVLWPTQVESYLEAAWEWMKGFGTGIDPSKPETLITSNIPPGVHCLIQNCRVGHAEFFWKLRAESQILSIFADLWDCKPEDLIVSFDGMNFGLPARIKQSKWAHLDQTKKSSEPLYYQGCVSLTKTNGGLNFLSGSHKVHSQFVDTVMNKTKKPGFYKLSEQEHNWYLSQPNITEEFVPSEPGELTIWDSRTVHWGRRPETHPGESLYPVRICMYVCYIPRNHLLRGVTDPKKIQKYKEKIESHLEKRVKTFEEHRMTTHQPYPVKLFPKKLRHYGNEAKEDVFCDQAVIKKEQLTNQMLLLIGY